MVKEEGKFYNIMDVAGPGGDGRSGAAQEKVPEAAGPRYMKRRSIIFTGNACLSPAIRFLRSFWSGRKIQCAGFWNPLRGRTQ